MKLHVLFAALPLLFPVALFAADHDRHATSSPAAADSAKSAVPWAQGTIKKIAKGSVVLAHGPIENIGMSAMTMKFGVRNEAVASLAKLKVGDNVRFQAEMADGEVVVVRIEPAK